MQNRFIWILILLFAFQATKAQSTASEYENAYKKALEAFRNQEYAKAQNAFAALEKARQSISTYTPYAYYFEALSAIHLHKVNDARTYLNSLLTIFPAWNDKDEVNYLLTNIAFEEKKYAEAFSIAQKITKPTLLAELAEMKYFYTEQITSAETLEELFKKFPDEAILSDKKLKKSSVSVQNATKKVAKGYYNFGLLLPIDFANISIDKTRKNQYALDLYQGMKLAKTQLLKENITINLFVYDVGNDIDQMLELINNQSFQSMDLLIGPLYAETNKIASTYCELNKIPILNPIANSNSLIKENNQSYLAQPSIATQASNAVDFVRQQTFMGRNVAIYYTDSPVDSAMATIYKQKIENIGYEVVKFEKIKTSSEDIATKLPDGKVSHIFLATSDKKAGLSMITALNKKDNMSPLVTSIEAFNPSSLSSTTLSGREVYCINPEFVDNEKPEVDAFRKDYLAKYGVVPSYYAFHGYDMALFWGRLFGKNGYNIRKGLDNQETYNNGTYTLSGFNYIKSQDNQISPVTTFQNYKFVLAK
ncbi:ABC transporter substrate-binding protein [Arcicella rigui]|uniref:ABC transporter substrate-binding protein n=1 Tax=Arcicella rigui TaxID=797020 RepID=A0ABU5Q5H2_9BACT|nr:ABC transporter substrate-binding protein [Arcicella rigui]MEA5138008.1 ABC transporter substrate-binding protein [Arcicella rigui]